MKKSVLICNGVFMRMMIKNIMRNMNDIDIFETEANHMEIMMAVYNHEPDVIMFPMQTNDFDGIKLLRVIRERDGAVKVIMFLSTSEDQRNLYLAAQAGLTGYITTPITPIVVLETLNKVLLSVVAK